MSSRNSETRVIPAASGIITLAAVRDDLFDIEEGVEQRVVRCNDDHRNLNRRSAQSARASSRSRLIPCHDRVKKIAREDGGIILGEQTSGHKRERRPQEGRRHVFTVVNFFYAFLRRRRRSAPSPTSAVPNSARLAGSGTFVPQCGPVQLGSAPEYPVATTWPLLTMPRSTRK